MSKEAFTFEIEYQREQGVYCILVDEAHFNLIQQIIVDGLKAIEPDRPTAFSYRN